MSKSLDEFFTSWRATIEDGLVGLSEACGESHGVLVEPIQYVLLGGGKRLRALLALALCHDLHAEVTASDVRNRAHSCAVAIETLHAASLVHDDLPSLDNDDLRRGKPSCHKAFNEATAVLVGDALVGAAMLCVLGDETLPTDLRARASRVLSHVWRDLCVGQQLDLGMGVASDRASRAEMIRLKTGYLFGAAAGCGAICAGVRDGDIARYFNWGVRIGECFQALDDLDDGDRPEEQRGDIERECRTTLHDLSSALGIPETGVSHGVASVILGITA